MNPLLQLVYHLVRHSGRVLSRAARAPLLLLAALALLAAPTHAQTIRVQAALERDRILAGDQTQYQIIIENSQDVVPPSLVAPPGLTIEYAGASHQPSPVMIVNGRRMDTGPDRYILLYRVGATAPGVYTIPAQRITVAGAEHALSPQRLTVTEPPADSSSILEAALSSDSAYVGEPIRLTLTWYFAADARGVRFSTLQPLESCDVFPAPDPRPAGARPNDSRFVTLQFDGADTVCTIGRTLRNGREYGVVTAQRTIVPTAPGDLEIGPFSAIAEVKTGERTIGILLTEDILERRVSRSEPVRLRVRPLPTEGRPSNFTGLVGRFSIAASAEPTQVSVGDPITLHVRINGPEPLERLSPPDLERLPDYTAGFRLSADGLRQEGDPAPGHRTFSTTVRATSDRVTALPPVELPYFDTEVGEYRTARSEPIPLIVHPTRQVTAQDAVSAASPPGSGPPAPSPARTPLLSAPGGLHAISTSAASLRNEHADLRTLLTQPAWAAGVALPPLAFAAAALYVLARRAAPTSAQRHRHAARVARRILRARSGSVGEALRTYLALRYDTPASAITSFDARRLLAADDPAAAEFADLLDRAEAARLAGSQPPSAQEAEHAIGRRAPASPSVRSRPSAPAPSAALLALALLLAPGAAPRAIALQPAATFEQRSTADLHEEAAAVFQRGLRAHEAAPGSGTAEFLRAAALYESILEAHGIDNHTLHANRASALLLAGDTGRAIAAFRRAQKLDPTNPAVRQGLAAARARVGSGIAPSPTSEAREILLAWRGRIPRPALLAVAFTAYVIAWLAAALRLLAVRRATPIIPAAAIVCALAAAPLAIEAALDNRDHGVVIVHEVIGLNGPSRAVYAPTFAAPLTAGVELDILEVRDEWLRVRLTDGRETWLPATAIERI